MSDTTLAFEQLTDTARLALARGDRESARVSLSMALHSADADQNIAAETPEALIRLGGLYHDAGLSAEAERLFADAVAVAERTLGPQHIGLGQALARLGIALIARGAHDEAEPRLIRALAISEQQLGVDNADLNVLLNALSRLYLRRGAFDRAAPLLDRLLAMKRVKGEDHPEVATVLASLALVRQGLGDHEGAEQLGRRVLQIRERTLAPNHYGIASALELLADACAARGKIAEALLLYQRALSIREQTLGVSHASLRVARERIADLQLQAAEETADDDLLPLLAPPAAFAPWVPPAPSAPVAAPSAPAPAPARAPAPTRPVALPADAAATLTLGLTIAPRAEIERAATPPVRAAEVTFADDHDAPEQRQQALVLPAFTGALSLHDELRNIENEMNEAAAAGERSRLAVVAASLWTAISTRRAKVAIAGVGVVALLVAVRIAQPRASEETGAAGRQPESLRTASPAGATSSRAVAAGANADSSLVGTANGALGPRAGSASTPSARSAAPTREAATRSQRDEAESAPSLEIGRSVRAPVPTVNIAAGDSIARAAQPGVGGDGFSKQFWTSALGQKNDADVAAPKNAKLIGDMPQPYYPEFLRKNNVEGEVAVQFMVDDTGRPDLSTFEVVRSPHDALTNSVRKVVERMRFEPALTGGAKPVPRTEVVQISFVFTASAK